MCSLILFICANNTLHIQIVSTVHEENVRMLYELSEQKLKKAEEDAEEELHMAKFESSLDEQEHLSAEKQYIREASEAVGKYSMMADENIRLGETIESYSQKVADMEGEISRYVFSLRQMCFKLDQAKVQISQLKAADLQNAATLKQMKSDLAKILEGNIVMRNEEGDDQDDTFYYDTPTLIDDQAGSVTKGVKKVHYLVRHLGGTVLKCSTISIADEIISVKDTSGCYTTYIHTKKPCDAASMAQCLKAAAGVSSFRIVYIPSFGIKHLIQYRTIAVAIRHQHASLTMERTNASDQTPFRQFKQFLVGVY